MANQISEEYDAKVIPMNVNELKKENVDSIMAEILKYKEKNNLTTEKCAEDLKLTLEQMQMIESNESIEIAKEIEAHIEKVLEKANITSSRRVVRGMDLIFRFVAMVMALVTLLLCINENVDTKVLIILLSIGLVCSSMTILPKIEK